MSLKPEPVYEPVDMTKLKEEVIIREIPEVSGHMRKVNMIPLQAMINKGELKDQFKHYFIKQDNDYNDTDVEEAMIEELKAQHQIRNSKNLSKEQALKAAEKPKIFQFINNYGQRVQNLQLRDTSGRLERVIF
jgi:hypothetical protein